MTDLSSESRQAAIDLAIESRQRAYCPYSGFRVGAAVIGVDGSLFSGCNIENCSFSLTNCAERVALQSAIASGVNQFSHLVVCSDGGVAPCGSCRQVLAEFAPELEITLVDAQRPDQYRTVNLRELLPAPFSGDRLRDLQ